jgi:hypothetical protein
MPLNRAEFILPPGSGLTPIGGVKAGVGIKITPTGVISVSSGFPVGSMQFFFQATAPVDYVSITTNDNVALRIVSGSGGGTGGTNSFTTAFTTYTPEGTNAPTFSGFSVSGSTNGAAVSVSQMGNHAHTYASPQAQSATAQGPGPLGVPVACNTSTSGTGGNGQHFHSLGGSLSGNAGAYVGTSTNQFAVRYLDFLLCEKT